MVSPAVIISFLIRGYENKLAFYYRKWGYAITRCGGPLSRRDTKQVSHFSRGIESVRVRSHQFHYEHRQDSSYLTADSRDSLKVGRPEHSRRSGQLEADSVNTKGTGISPVPSLVQGLSRWRFRKPVAEFPSTPSGSSDKQYRDPIPEMKR